MADALATRRHSRWQRSLAALVITAAACLSPLGRVAFASSPDAPQAPEVLIAAGESASSSQFEPRADPFGDDPATERGYLILGGLTVAVVCIGVLFARSVRRAQANRPRDSRYSAPDPSPEPADNSRG